MIFLKDKPIKDKNLVKLYALSNTNCEVCGVKGSEVHHIEFKGMGGGRGGDNHENLITLCRYHHNCAHGLDSKWWKEHLTLIKRGEVE